jgi:hypothetical protein
MSAMLFSSNYYKSPGRNSKFWELARPLWALAQALDRATPPTCRRSRCFLSMRAARVSDEERNLRGCRSRFQMRTPYQNCARIESHGRMAGGRVIH